MNESRCPTYQIESDLEQLTMYEGHLYRDKAANILSMFRKEFVYPRRELEVHPNQMRLF